MALTTQAGRARLQAYLGDLFGAASVEISDLAMLGGGAIQENWSLTCSMDGGERPGSHRWILRTDAPSGIAASWSRAQEFAILTSVFEAGVLVPEPVSFCAQADVIGKPFCLMAWRPGEARGHKLIRDKTVLANGDGIAADLGHQLAKIHRLQPPLVGLEFIPEPSIHPALARIEQLQGYLARHQGVQPVIELTLDWLGRHLPEPNPVCLTHGDLRTGNFLVEAGSLASILDWEFSAISDPLEDLGWLTAACWRFGNLERTVGGIGALAPLLTTYQRLSGIDVNLATLGYWQLMATARWAVLALEQAGRSYDQGDPSLELALTAEIVPELEWDMLELMDDLERSS